MAAHEHAEPVEDRGELVGVALGVLALLFPLADFRRHRQVNHDVRPLDRRFPRSGIANVADDGDDAVFETCLRLGVSREAQDPVPVRDQLAADRAADRAGGPGDEHRGGVVLGWIVGRRYRPASRPSHFHASGSAAAARPIFTTSPGTNGQKPSAHTFEAPT